jgi:hypothetical protein
MKWTAESVGTTARERSSARRASSFSPRVRVGGGADPLFDAAALFLAHPHED